MKTSDNEKGFTVIELLVVIVIVGVLISMVRFSFSTPGAIKKRATERAEAYVTQLNAKSGGNYKLLTCVTDDHENDGYVTCTVLNPGQIVGTGTQEPISCTYRLFSDGCKPYTNNKLYPQQR